MQIIIAIFWLVILMLVGTIIVKEQIKQSRIALIKPMVVVIPNYSIWLKRNLRLK
ncbi:hypothetical protein WL354_11315 [Staphylococcus epidermidis]|jgi:hypothetical protein|uniref:hypothetical protein n=1 Tax=Staphylococcus epidermidis TaxID=1282 RepID=UPI00138AAEF2|nr:hypothetical protein [Staphylococcus epidermidis]MBC2941641.1 hypothetical protein [Staphylococcus epidermidis]MBC2964614.1 hypothetical protein [Staphylococcus epidermidis]MBM6147042.1 hypothetical protein [Staphylococcus epidermidis]